MGQHQALLPDHRQAGALRANVAEDGFETIRCSPRSKRMLPKKAAGRRLCASIEAEIADLDDADKIDFLADGPEEPASTA
jgi:hypothetical protein